MKGGISLALLAVLILCVARAQDVRDGKCYPGFNPEKNEEMSTCCWYSAQTCCKSNVAGLLLPAVTKQLEEVHKNGTNNKCYIAVADLLCLWCSPETAKFTEGEFMISVSICYSMCTKLWDACSDQQDAFGIKPKALTPRQLCTALLVEEEDKETPQGGVSVVIAQESSKDCYGGVPHSVVENSNCLPHISKSVTTGPSGGAITAMVLVPFLVIGLTVVAVVLYFRMRKRREGQAGGLGGRRVEDDGFSLPADAFGEEGGFLDEKGDINEGGASSDTGSLLSDEDRLF